MIGVLVAAAAALPPQWNRWQWSSAIAASRAVMQQVTVPVTVLGKAKRGLDDVRVIDARGDEVPYAIVIRRGSQQTRYADARIDDYGFVRGKHTQFVASVPVPQTDYTSLELSTAARQFSTAVDVYASDDRQNWRLIRANAPIFDFQRDGLGSNTSVRIPPSHARYYRVYVDDGAAAFAIDGVRFAQGGSTPARLSRYAAIRTRMTQEARTTVVIEDLGYAHIPLSLVRIDTSSGAFARRVTIEASDDARTWTQAGSGTVERRPGRERQSISFGETAGRYWRVTISNGEDRPLSRLRIELWAVPRHIVYRRGGAASGYRLVYGNPSARAAQYDFARVQTAAALAAALPVSLGPPERNANYLPAPVPWSESHRWVLWAALALAAVLIGLIALRVLAAPGEASGPA